jgi:hypothetical protein
VLKEEQGNKELKVLEDLLEVEVLQELKVLQDQQVS